MTTPPGWGTGTGTGTLPDRKANVGGNPAGTVPADTDALKTFTGMLVSWGFDTSTASALAGQAVQWSVQGYGSDSISYLLQQTPEYKQRFSGNDIRVKNGLAALSPAQYLATEASYQSVMRAYGLPKSFYDTPDDYANFIGSNMSGTELTDRVKLASDLVNRTDPTARNQLWDYYGIDSSHLIAHFLDPTAAAPILQKQVSAAEIGGAAYAQGLSSTSKQQAERFADMGVTEGQARSAYGQIAAELPTEKQIASRFGGSYDQTDAENVYLGNDGDATRKRAVLNQKESNLFGGDTGLPSTLYGNTGRAAAIGIDTSGSY